MSDYYVWQGTIYKKKYKCLHCGRVIGKLNVPHRCRGTLRKRNQKMIEIGGIMREFKVGDKVKHIEYGWGKVKEITYGDYSLNVYFDIENHHCLFFTSDGKLNKKTPYRSLYHADEPFVDPPRPMKKVKVGAWFNPYKKDGNYFVGSPWASRELAEDFKTSDCIGKPIYLETEIEVEE